MKGSYELIVVDNGSRRPPAGICARYGASLHVETIPGPGPARNLGVSHAQGEYLAFIDADCTAHEGWLAEIERCFDDDPQIGIIGGDVRIARETPGNPTWLEAYESVFAYRMKEYIARQGFTGTGNLGMRRSVFDAVGRFGGIEVAEDRDWGQRARSLGYVTHYRPDMIVYHPARKSFAEIAAKWRRHTLHDFEAARRRPLWWARWVLRAAAVALSPAAETVRIGLSDRVSGWRERALAIYGVLIVRQYRAAIMLSLAFGVMAPESVGRWNRA